MHYTILLNRDDNTKEIETQEQFRFIKSILETIQAPIEFNPEKEFTIEDKIKFKQELSHFNINIIDDMDGGLKIYVEKDLIAEWIKPTYVLMEDKSNIDLMKKLYLKMNITFRSVFENDS
jgi:hypothetical protein